MRRAKRKTTDVDTCEVEGEEEEEEAREEVAEEGDHSAGDALGHWVDRLDEELEEDGYAAVDEDTKQDTGRVERGYREKDRERKQEREIEQRANQE